MTARGRGALIATVILALVVALMLGSAGSLGRWVRGLSAGAGALAATEPKAEDSGPGVAGGARIGPGVAIARRAVKPAVLARGYYSEAEARAYAAAGLAADGNAHALDGLDPASRAALARMRAELARQSPTVSTTRAGSGAVSGGAGASGPSAHLDLAHVDRGITGSPGSQVITGSQVWALAHLDPSLGRLDIENRSGGDYTISLFGSDFGSVRLNGGLVVPGRAYAIGSGAEITGDAAVAVHIRPAGVATAVYPGPLLPQGDG